MKVGDLGVVLSPSVIFSGLGVGVNSGPAFSSFFLVLRGSVDGELDILCVGGKRVDTGRSPVNDMLSIVVDIPLPASELPD